MTQGSAWGEPLGLDELMIVNPSPPRTGSPNLGGLFLGEDGTLYQLQGLPQPQPAPKSEQLFLGEDGTLYRLEDIS